MKRKKLWAKSVGERGNRVRLYEPRPGANLMRSVWINGKEDRRSLGHRDRDLAVRQAYAMLAQVSADEDATQQETLSLGMLVHAYLDSPSHARKKHRTQKADERKLRRVTGFLGPARSVDSLCESYVIRFTAARRKGDSSLIGVRKGRVVSDRTVEMDLIALMTALNWATRERDRAGNRLLRENPLYGVKLPKEKNPRRPVMTHTQYLALLEVAPRVDARLEAALVVAEGTGRRLSAVRQLRWEDIDFSAGTIRWIAENDKKGFDQVVPMAPRVAGALKALRAEFPAIGSAWVFPSPKDPARPCGRHLLKEWLKRAYKLAGLERERGGLWHPIRRKWATERKDYPVNDVAVAGGWRDTDTLLRCYQQADEQTLRRVILEPTHRLEPRDPGETHNRTHNTPAGDEERPRSVARHGTGS